MAKQKVAEAKRSKQRVETGAHERIPVPWADWAAVRDDLWVWLHDAVNQHPDLMADLATAWAFVDQHPLNGLSPMIPHMHAIDWLQARYPRIWRYPLYLQRDVAYSAIGSAMMTGNWDGTWLTLFNGMVVPLYFQECPVAAQVWLGRHHAPRAGEDTPYWPMTRVVRPEGEPVVLGAVEYPMPTPRIRLCADDTYVELGPSVNNPFYILEGRRGHTRKDLHDALDRAIDALERTCPGYIAAAPQGRPARGTARNPKWRHFPALYRFWHEHPTDWIPEQFRDRQVAWERFALRLLQGRRPLAWEEFAGNVLEVRSGDTAHRYWVDAYPDDWDRNTSYSTVERDTKAAIEWLAPEPAVPAIPEAQCGPLSH